MLHGLDQLEHSLPGLLVRQTADTGAKIVERMFRLRSFGEYTIDRWMPENEF